MKNIIKGIVSVALIGSMMMSFAGCTSFNRIEYNDFKDALENEVKLAAEDCKTGKNKKRSGYEMKRYIVGEKGNCEFKFYEFKEEDDAIAYFEKEYDELIGMIEYSDEFDGTYKENFDEDSATGYILFDGEYFGEVIYGGVFLKEDTYIYVISEGNKDKDRDRVDAVLDAIGYPKP